MSKHKSTGKEKKKGSQLVIRVDKTERDAFVMLCDELDTSAAREIRRFMRELVAAHAGADAVPEAVATSVDISDVKGDEPVGVEPVGENPIAVEADIAVNADVEFEAPTDGAEKPKKRQKRVSQ